MRRRIVSFILSLAMIASIGLYFQTNQVLADESLARYVMGAETLPDGKIAVLFIKGGETTSLGDYGSWQIVNGGYLYYGVYDPETDDWSEEAVGDPDTQVFEAALTVENGTPYIAYVTLFGEDKGIVCTHKSNDTWVDDGNIQSLKVNADNGNLTSPDIAVVQGDIYVSYLDTHGAEDDRYVLPDVMCANNSSGAFVPAVVESCTGWFESPDGNKWWCKDPFIDFNDNGYVMAYWFGNWDKWYNGNDYGYHTYFVANGGKPSLCDDWKNPSVYGIEGLGEEAWALIYVRGCYKFVQIDSNNNVYNDIALETSNIRSALTEYRGGLYFAGIEGTNVVFGKKNDTAIDLTSLTAEVGRYSGLNRVFTTFADGEQYLIYTGDDEERSLVIAKYNGDNINEFLVPNIYPEPTPKALFEATGVDSGILTDVAAGMKYSIDGGETWIDIADTSVTIDSGITLDKGIKVYQPATSAITADSAVQDVVVTKADTPTLVPVQPSVIDGKGSIPTTSAYEYSTDGTTYTACTDELTDLVPGTYYVRAVASGTALTSDPQEIEIVAFVPNQEEIPEAVFDATGPDSGELSNVGPGMKYSIDGGSTWVDIDTSVTIDSGISVENGIKVYMPGNGTTTIDSDVQTIEVTKADKPSLTVTQPWAINGKGSVATSSIHEWSSDGTSYTACTGELTDLEPGTYYVRVAGSGIVLASDPQEIEIVAFVPEKENTPSGTFVGIGTDSGSITGIDPDMQYSLDQGSTWINVGGETTSKTIDRGISVANGIWLKMPGNGITTIDSDIQKIAVSQPDAPELTVVQPSVIGGKGFIATTDKQEYSTDQESYQSCNGELTDLDAGTYYIRFYGDQGSLASESTTVVIKEFEPAKEDTPQAVFTKTGDESGELTNVASGMKYSLDGTNWVDITGTTAVIESGVTTGTVITIYMPGNGTTTIDSDVQEIEVPLYYKVTFDTNGGNEIAAQYVVSGEKAAKPDDPVREGMVFNG